MRKLRRWIELSADERNLLARATVLLPIARLAIAWFGFNRTHRLFRRMFAKRPPAPPQVDSTRPAETAVKMVRVAALHGVCQANCLPRSLVTWALLRRQGFDPALRFGARKKTGKFEAHAWVTLGSVVLDSEPAGVEDAFVPFGVNRHLNELDGVVR